MDGRGDTITAIPDNFKIIASTDKVAICCYQVSGEEVWGVGPIRKCFIARMVRRCYATSW